ncbi:MAG TPA: aldehyde dehydrogenase family protein, partial [Candidatus Salinicoccus merdavium]|nr:aldehyde dehydrogenase family protein [Candidatus Salinicoccus merdavium]
MYESIFNKQKQFFQTKETMPLDIRIKALKQLKDAIRFYEDDLMFAMRSDFNKNESDAFLTEIGIVYSEINFHLKHLSEWAESVNVKTPVT